MPLNRTTIQIPFVGGLSQRSDMRASSPPTLDIALNVQADEAGGLQTRYPFALQSTNILGGGTIANPRKLVENGNELILFTDVGLYSWSAEASAWVLKGTHLAVAVDEETVFATTGDQIDADRAELGGVIFYAWTNAVSPGVTRVWLSAVDSVTGAVLMAPTNPLGASNGSIPRLVALATKVMLFWSDAVGDLIAVPLDPATATIGTAIPVVASPTFAFGYDVCRIIGADQAVVVCMSNPTTSYQVTTVSTTAVIATHTVAKTAGTIACSSAPGGNNLVQVVRSPTNILLKGELIDISTMTVLATDQAIAAPANLASRIALAHRSVQDSGQYRCYAFWAENESTTANMTLKSNWVDTGGTIGAAVTLNRNLGVASRAFDYAGRIYFWTVYAMSSSVSFAGGTFRSSLQNSYFLYRDDGFLCAKAASSSAAGYPASYNQLPGVQLVAGSTQFAWCGGTRRIIRLGANGSTGYSSRAPRDIAFAFDSNAARRCARIGSTLYIAAGELLQYDGEQLYEVGFHTYPARASVAAASGSMDDGTYAWKPTYCHVNGAGERDRSTSVSVQSVALSGGAGSNGGDVATDNLYVTHRTQAITTGYAPLIEIWRTAKNPTADSPFYKVTSDDPSLGAVANNLIASNNTQFGITTGSGAGGLFHDALVDASATLRENNHENGAILPCLSPPASKLIIATQDRLFLAAVAGDPDRVWYSRQRQDGEVASFNDALTIDVPRAGGDITAIAYAFRTLFVYREHATYAFQGDGFDNTGNGQNFALVHISSNNVGALNQESVCTMPDAQMFKSAKGWHVVGQDLNVTYIGGPIVNYDGETVVAAHLVEGKHHVRVLTTARMLLLDYVNKQWFEWTISGGLSATSWRGQHLYLTSSGAMLEQNTYDLADYDIDVELAWLKLADLQGAGSVRRIQLIGGWQSQCQVRMRVARDDESDGAGGWVYFDDVTWTPDTSTVGDKLQEKHGPSRPKCSASKVRITSIRGMTTNGDGLPVAIGGRMLDLTGLAFEVGIRPNLNRRLSAAQKV